MRGVTFLLEYPRTWSNAAPHFYPPHRELHARHQARHRCSHATITVMHAGSA